jgi:taurine dioxygenase
LRPGQKYPQASHPIITRHPETGRSLLSVNKSFTSHVEGIPRWESDMLLSGCMILSPRMLEFSVG